MDGSELVLLFEDSIYSESVLFFVDCSESVLLCVDGSESGLLCVDGS